MKHNKIDQVATAQQLLQQRLPALNFSIEQVEELLQLSDHAMRHLLQAANSTAQLTKRHEYRPPDTVLEILRHHAKSQGDSHRAYLASKHQPANTNPTEAEDLLAIALEEKGQ